MIMNPVVVPNAMNDFTTIMSKATDYRKPIIKKDRQVVAEKNKPSKNEKIMIIIGVIILVMVIAFLGKYLSKGHYTEAQAPSTKTTVPKVSVELPTDEKKLVPSLIGSTQDIAEQTILSNGFLIGNISKDYSNSIAKGLVINQSPVVNILYEKSGKIDLVISQGQKNV